MSKKRPQEPKRPFSYEEREVVFTNHRDGTVRNGTLTVPEGEGTFPAAVLITGSGAHNRDEAILGHKPFLVIADYLTRAGIAVLRYDDRHYKMKPKKGLEFTADDFAGDAAAAVSFLQNEACIDAACIGFIGHSEGGLIAPIAASLENSGVGYIIALAGPGISGGAILIQQAEDFHKKKTDVAFTREWLQALSNEVDRDKRRELLRETAIGIYGRFSVINRLKVRLAAPLLCSPWYYEFLRSEPAVFWKKVSCPIFALFGENDVQVHAKENSEAMRAALEEGGNTRYSIKIVEGANHLFQRSGLPVAQSLRQLYMEYYKTSETIAEDVLQDMAAWIQSISAKVKTGKRAS